MKFENTFAVDAPIDEVYATLLDVERVAPCVPGAEVLEKTGDDAYQVAIKVRVGPISMTYRGNVEIVERDDANHRAVMRARARETRGQGTADARVDLSLAQEGETTNGTMVADVQLAGRAAAMGRGVIQDVSAKLVDQFANNLGSMLGTQPAAAAATNGGGATEAPSQADTAPASGGAQTPAGAGSAAGSDAETKAGSAAPSAATGPSSQQAWTPPDQDEGVDALGIAASVAGDRLKDPKVLAGLAGIAILLVWLLGRRS